ncbi:MAG TPA: hypothetical protein VM493_00920 [Vicinamibacterales bacterium]|nr:hypothetical protein [Vicinamibacterales bacterium]
MSQSKKLGAAEKRNITADWQREFPVLATYKPMWLLKRHGPLLVGLMLDRDSSNELYIPTFHVHNLLAPSPSISLSLIYNAPGEKQPRMARQIRVDRHESAYLDVAAFFKKATPELDAVDLSLSRAIQLHFDFVREKRDYAVAKRCWTIFSDVALLAAWGGHEAYARDTIDGASRLMSEWNLPFDVSEWSTAVRDLARPELMKETLSSEIAKHKLDAVPVFDLSAGDPGELSAVQVYHEAWGPGAT